ncbi:putative membrane protein [Rhizobium mongolense]|uniref:Putative membrane protein n=2 Tax=Rhizobium mongolense TaxID=57676 RepID=A0A7W6WGS9_9HYPH|nr:putative membrane protein [Rhizobium mongolense]
MRNNFLAGLIICAPIAITLWLTWSVVRWADSWVKPYIPARYDPDSYLNFAVPGSGLVIAMIFITIIGFLGKNLIGQTIVQFGESVVRRVPLVRSIYRSVKQIFETVLEERSNSFKKVGLIEYPSPGLWALVFIATDAKGEIASKFNAMGQDMVSVFLPPTPVPTAGFLIFVPREKIVVLDMSAEDGAKLLVSGGLVAPDFPAKPSKEPAVPGKPRLLARAKKADRFVAPE